MHGSMAQTPITMKTSLISRSAALGVLLLGLSALTLTSGCVAVAASAGAGAVAYVRGDLETTLEANVDRTVRAASRAVQQLEFVKVSETKDALLGIIIARNAADKKIRIRIDRTTDNLTHVSIRVGVFGDESISLAILDKLKGNL